MAQGKNTRAGQGADPKVANTRTKKKGRKTNIKGLEFGVDDPDRPDAPAHREFDAKKYGDAAREAGGADRSSAIDKIIGGGQPTGLGGGGGSRSAGSSSSGGSRGGKKGGGIKGDNLVIGTQSPEVRARLEREVLEGLDDDRIFELDKSYGERSQELLARIEANRGKLYELDPETAAQFDEMTEADLAMSRRGFKSQQSDLLTRLFGQGAERSSTAGEVGRELIGDQQLVEGQINAQGHGREIATRQFLTQQGQENLALQSGTLDSERSAELQNLGLQAGQVQGNKDRASALLGTFEQTQAQRDTATIAGRASVTSSRLQAGAIKSAAKSAANAAVKSAGIRAGATRFAAAQSAAASRANALAGLEATRYSSDARTSLGLFQTDVGQDQFGANLDFQFYNADLNASVTRDGYEAEAGIAAAAAKAKSKSNMLGGLLAAGGAVIGGFYGGPAGAQAGAAIGGSIGGAAGG